MNREDSGFVDVGDASVFYRVMGRGQPLLLLHGWGQTHRVFLTLARHLSSRYRVIMMDRRGSGASAAMVHDFSIPRYAGDALAVLDSLGVDQAVVLGFSDGANAALHMAIAAPERVRAIVAISANAQPDGMDPRFDSAVRAYRELWGIAGRVGIAAGSQTEKIDQLLHGSSLSDDQLASICAPTMLLRSSHDVVQSRHTIHLGQVIPHAQIMTVSRSVHFTMVAQWRRWVIPVEAFLRRIG